MNEKQINKFIHKGNLLDYEKEYVKSNKNIREIDYQEYKNLQEQKIKHTILLVKKIVLLSENPEKSW